MKLKQKEDDLKLVSNLSEAQKKRYEAYKSVRLDGDFVKDVIANSLKHKSTSSSRVPLGKSKAEFQNISLVIRDVAQMYVGDIVEKSREVMKDFGHTGPIRPIHMREAYRRLQNHSQNLNIRESGKLFGGR
mmetsp:Transcript_3384/g.6332  ORF Transcript_3384/g.6332 Transcript_3384/m.6332 type:complete len:131 (-) Transcript_3384:210-602(-)